MNSQNVESQTGKMLTHRQELIIAAILATETRSIADAADLREALPGGGLRARSPAEKMPGQETGRALAVGDGPGRRAAVD